MLNTEINQQNRLKQMIQNFIKQQEQKFTPQFLRQNKVRPQPKIKLFQMLRNNENIDELKDYINSKAVANISRQFLKDKFIDFYQKIKSMKLEYIKEITNKLNMKKLNKISDQLQDAIYNKSFNEICSQLKKIYEEEQSINYGKNIIKYLEKGEFQQIIEIKEIQIEEQNPIKKYLKYLYDQYYIEQDDLKKIEIAIQNNVFNEIKQLIVDHTADSYEQVQKQIKQLGRIYQQKRNKQASLKQIKSQEKDLKILNIKEVKQKSKRIYIAIKLNDKISIHKNNKVLKLYLKENSNIIKPTLIRTQLKYYLMQFEINHQLSSYLIQYIPQNQRSKIGTYKIQGNILQNQQNYFYFQQIYQPYQQIIKMDEFERYFIFCILGNENLFNQIILCFPKKQYIFIKILERLKEYKQNNDIKDLKKIFKKSKVPNIISYAFAYLYEIHKQFNLIDHAPIYIQKYFLQEQQFCSNHDQLIISGQKQLYIKCNNSYQRVMLELQYFQKKRKKIQNRLIFNELLQNYEKKSFGLLMRIIQNQVNEKYKDKNWWQSIRFNLDINKLIIVSEYNKNKIKQIISNNEDLSITQFTYYRILELQFNHHFSNSQKILNIYQIVKVIKNRISIQKSQKQTDLNMNLCIKIINQCYKEIFMEDYLFLNFYSALADFPESYQKIFITNILEQNIQSFIKIAQNKNQFYIKLLRLVFIQKSQALPILADKSESLLKKIFINPHHLTHNSKKQYHKKIQFTWIEKLIDQVVFQFYIKKISINKFENKQQKPRSYIVFDILIQYLVQHHLDFQKNIEVFNKGSNKLDLSKIQQKSILDYVLIKIFSRYSEKSQKFYVNLITKKQFLFIFKLKKYISDFIIDLIIKKIKQFCYKNKQQYNTYLVLMCEYIFYKQNIPNQEKDRILENICDHRSFQQLNMLQLKYILYEKPFLASIYVKSRNNGNSMIEGEKLIFQLKQNLKKQQINYGKIQKIKNYNIFAQNKLIKLFDYSQNLKLYDLINELHQKCSDYIQKFDKIIGLLTISQEIGFLNEILKKVKIYKYKFQKGSIDKLQFIQYEQLECFKILIPEVYKFFNLPYLKFKVLENKFENQKQFCLILNKCISQIIEKVTDIYMKYVNKILQLKELLEISNNLVVKQIAMLLKKNEKITQMQINIFSDMIYKIKQLDNYSKINDGIIYLFNIHHEKIKQNNDKLSKIFQKYKNKQNNLKVHQIQQLIINFQKQLDFKYSKDDEFIKILQLIHPSHQLWEFCKKITIQLIQDLKDYFNDQQQRFINTRNITELAYAYKFYVFITKQSKSTHEFLKNLRSFIQKNLQKQHEYLSVCIEQCMLHRLSLQKIYYESTNRQEPFKLIISVIIQDSTIFLQHKMDKKQLKIQFLNRQNKQSSCSLKQLTDWRDKSLLLINSIKKQNKNNENIIQKVLSVQSFIQLFKKLQTLLLNYKNLQDMGYFYHFIDQDQNISFKILNQNYSQIDAYNQKLQKQCQRWKSKLQQAYFRSITLCHFQGKQLKKMTRKLFNNQYCTILDHIWKKGKNSQKFLKLFKQKYDKRDQDPINKLQILIKLFNEFQKIDKMEKEIIEKESSKIQVKMIQLEQKMFYYGINAGATNKDINMPQILLCRNTTNQYQLKTFLLRAILDNQHPYFILGTHYLSAKIQNNFCEFINQFNQTQILKSKIKYMNLYIISNSKNQRIYNFIATNNIFKLIKIQKDALLKKSCKQYFFQKAGNFKIVFSHAAGLGKTFFIQKEIQSKKLTAKYFPVAGNLELNRLYQRIIKLNIQKDSALIIQIHNIKEKKILEEFLFQIIFFKCLKHQNFLFLPENLHIYVQLENVLNQKYFEQYQTLKIFEENKKFIRQIKEISLKQFEVNQKDPKLMFIFRYLDWLKQKTINKNQITYEEFKQKFSDNQDLVVKQNRVRQLLDYYLISPLKQKNNKPSYVQIQSFLSLLFQSLKTFASSFYYSVEQLNYYHQKFTTAHFQQYRQQYVNILIKNARQFLLRTVTEKSFQDQQQQDFQQVLSQFPFLILPNGDQVSFSFIYKNDKQVDQIIKKYILCQQGKLNALKINNSKFIQQKFQETSLNFIQQQKSDKLTKELKKILKQISNLPPTKQIKQDLKYEITLDNFFKMCLIVQRMRANIPIIIMGETGVGKTALIRFLVQNVFQDELMLINIHAGINQQHLITKIEQIKQSVFLLKGKRLWVFFDQFNTTQQVGYIKQIIMEKRFLGQSLPQNLIFLAACNPFRKKQKKQILKVGLQKKMDQNIDNILYKVLPPPQSLIQCMWNFQQLKTLESRQYIYSMLYSIKYRSNDISQVIHQTHQDFKIYIQKSAVNLRDVARFKILFYWFTDNMPKHPSRRKSQHKILLEDFNYKILRQQRAFILSICFCYYMRLQNTKKRNEYLNKIQKIMKFEEGYMHKVLQHEQFDYLNRMSKPKGIALNLALRENVFTSFVCLINKLPIIIVGRPGCSKSLSIRLLLSNLRGLDSEQDFLKNLPQIQMYQFQGSESCSSEGVQQVFRRAEALSDKCKDKKTKILPYILFDQIGLAQLSIHNPLKVLHSHLQVNQTKVSFIGISNWQLDASKMARFLVVNRTIPDQDDLFDTAKQIFQSQGPHLINTLKKQIKALSCAYYEFIQQWKKKINNDYTQFFGLRDFYNMIKYIVFHLKNDQNKDKQIKIIKRSIQRNFDGREDSVKMFLNILSKYLKHKSLQQQQKDDILSLIKENLNDKDARCLLQIIKGQSLIYILNQKQLNLKQKNIVTIHGSTFYQDKSSEAYNLFVISDIINYVSQGYVIILKDVPNNIQTSLYDLLNKSYQRVGNKNYARIAVGANYNPKCIVHEQFNCIVYIMQNRLKQVDPPFLNRFEKHYLTINKLTTQYQCKIIRSLKQWIDKLLNNILKKENPLLKEHYLINVCDQSLASLTLKKTIEINSDQQKQTQMEQIIKNSKKQLLMNSTTDFKLLLQTQNNIQDKQFINKCLDQKKKFIKQKINKQKFMIIYTYDKNTEINQENIIYEKQFTKIIKICELKSELQFRKQIQEFYRKKYTNCHVKFNYQNEHIHLCSTIFLFETMAKKFNNPEKRIYLILIISRLNLLNEGKTYKQVSYLNGYKQIFIQYLQKDITTVDQLPENFPLQKNPIFNLKENIQKIYPQSLKRFDYTYKIHNKKLNYIQQTHNQILNLKVKKLLDDLPYNQIFMKNTIKFILKNFSIEKQWKNNLLIQKEIAQISSTTSDAMVQYVMIKLEELLANYIKFIFQNEIIYCFDYNIGIEILQYEIPKCRQNLLSMLDQCKENYNKLLNGLLQKLISTDLKFVKKIPKEAGSNKIKANIPRLFPFILRQKKYLLQKRRNLEQSNENDVKREDTFQQICTQIYELEQKLQFKDSNQKKILQYEKKLKIQSKIKQVNNLIQKKTYLIEKQFNFINQMDTKSDWKKLKQIFLFDIRNLYLEQNIELDVSLSFEMQKLIKHFKNQNTTLIQQLMILLKGDKLWKRLLTIIQKLKQIEYYVQGFMFRILKEKSKGSFFLDKIKIIENLFEISQKIVSLDVNNIKIYGGIQKFNNLFNNLYLILQQFQNQLKNFNIKIPKFIRLFRNFIKTIENIGGQNTQTLLNEFFKLKQQNIYIKISKFLQQLKSMKIYNNNMILKHQAGYLYRYWSSYLKTIKNQQQKSIFITKCVDLINKQNQFAQSSYFIIWQLFIQINFRESKFMQIMKKLSNGSINNNIQLIYIKDYLNKNYQNNNLSVVLIDFFCKRIPQPNIQNKSPQEQLICFENYLKEIYDGIQLTFNQRQINSLQNLILLAFMKIFLNYYVQCLNKDMKKPIMDKIDKILSRQTSLYINLRLYCLKLLKKKLGSVKQIKNKFITIKRANWILKMKQFIQTESIEFLIPPQINPSKAIDSLINTFIESKYKKLDYLSQMFKLKSYHYRYKLFTFFMTDIYSGLCGRQQKQKINQFLSKRDPNLQLFQLDLLRRYSSSKITEQLYYSSEQSSTKLSDQTWILNNINFLMSIKNLQSPLTSIFFTKQGTIPKQFFQHTSKQFILCGKDNPYRISMQSALMTLKYQKLGVYICSKNCDFVYTIQDCGWPTLSTKCKFCEQDLGGTAHKLIRQNEGARRIGPKITYIPSFYAYKINIDYYWKWLSIYIQKQIERVIEKPQIFLFQKKLQNNKIVIKRIVTKLTGFTKFNTQTQTRIHTETYNILNLILNSLLYFFIQFKWISQSECKATFQGKSRQDIKISIYKNIMQNLKKIETLLDDKDLRSWIMGIQKEIFLLAAQYRNKIAEYKKQIQQKNKIERNEIIKVKGTLQKNEYKQMFDNVLTEGIIFQLPKIQRYTAHMCWNRDFFQKLTEKIIKQNRSGEDKFKFIKKSKNQKSLQKSKLEQILNQETLQIEKFTYSRLLRLTKEPSYQNMIKEYSMKINSQYPILDLIINFDQKFENIKHFYKIIYFVNKITDFASNNISRQIANTQSISKFIQELKITAKRKNQCLNSLDQCLKSWNILAKRIQIIQYQCKVLGKMNDKYSKQTPLIAFLIDSLDKNNYYGKILSGVFHLFGVEQNELINLIQSKKSTIFHLKNLKLFSQKQYLPQKITQKDILKIDHQQFQRTIQSLSSNSVEYGNQTPIYNFEVIQNKLIVQFYGKKRIVTNMQKFINIQFAGEMFSRMGKYSNYITQVRQVGGCKPLSDINEITKKFKIIQNQDENRYFITMKAIQGYLQKLMIYFKTFQPRNMSLREYIQKYEFKNYPQELIHFGNLPIQCIVSLYEELQLAIMNKTWQILPEIYKQPLTEAEQVKYKEFLSLLQKNDKQLPTLVQFKIAFFRLTSRCLVLADISQDQSLLQFLTQRKDFWPYEFPQQTRKNLENKARLKIQLKKSLSLKMLIDTFLSQSLNKTIKKEQKKINNSQQVELKKEKCNKRSIQTKKIEVNIED